MISNDDDWESEEFSKSCDHCGRFGMVYEHMITPSWSDKESTSAQLCHKNGKDYPKGKAGKVADVNCFALVSSGKEDLGDRLFNDEDDLMLPPWMEKGTKGQ